MREAAEEESGARGADARSVEPPAAIEIPGAETGEVAQIRAVVEAPPRVSFDPDLVRRRMVACFEQMKANGHDRQGG